jgi:pimeloyl-ACP methyl ester carboxylesterase
MKEGGLIMTSRLCVAAGRIAVRRVGLILMIAALLILPTAAPAQEDSARREEYLKQLKRILPGVPQWEAWLETSRELPPDFDALPSIPELPDPLLREVNGRLTPITKAADWPQQRARIMALFHQWVIGKVPPAPDNLKATLLSERRGPSAHVREVRLAFGPDHAATLRLILLIPDGPGPFPVFLTQEETRDWGHVAVRRGYLACIYATADNRDDTDTFVKAYPNYDWGRLTRRAWATSRAIDYLATVPEANTQQIALSGHSRYGKQSMIAAAMDERIKAVVSSSSGAGGVLPARYFSESDYGESIQILTRSFPDWFTPRFRFFSGREDKLPVDFHELVAAVAPRACLLSLALNDRVESSWAMQQTYLAAKPVYKLLGAEDRLRIMWRPGGHEIWTNVMERYFDWFDKQFRGARYEFPERFIHPWNWDEWRAKTMITVNPAGYPARGLDDALILKDGTRVTTPDGWQKKKEEVRAAITDMLGAGPPYAGDINDDYGNMTNLVTRYAISGIEDLLRRQKVPPGVVHERVANSPKMLETAVQLATSVGFEYLSGDIFAPTGLRESGKKAPAILWLPPFSFAGGYTGAYKRGDYPYHALAREGYVVFCFDPIGMSRRIEEVDGFYDRYPDYSLLGRMVRDSRAALDAVAALPYVDPQQIYVVGFSLGAMVGMHLGAVDDRPAGFALVGGPPPFRLDTAGKKTGGIARWSKLHMLAPRLGFFIGHERSVPYDTHLLLGALAPRPTLVVSPLLDYQSPQKDVTQAVAAAREVYRLHGADPRLEQVSPEDFNHFGPPMQQIVLKWLNGQAKK